MDSKTRIREFLKQTFFYSGELHDDESLLGRGIIDSTGVLEVVGFLETEFGIEVADEEMLPENLDSVRQLVEYVGRKLAHSSLPLEPALPAASS